MAENESKQRPLYLPTKGRAWITSLYLAGFIIDLALTLITWRTTQHLEMNKLYILTGSLWPVIILNLAAAASLWYWWPGMRPFGHYMISYIVAWITIARGYAIHNFYYNWQVGVTEAEAASQAAYTAAASQAAYNALPMAAVVLTLVALITWFLYRKAHDN